MILWTSNHARLSRFTGRFAGAMVALYITFESPLSGMSMNPARTVASALPAGVWTAAWIYFVAPVLAMLLASELYLRLMGAHRVYCAKLDHRGDRRCIFRCGYHVEPPPAPASSHPTTRGQPLFWRLSRRDRLPKRTRYAMAPSSPSADRSGSLVPGDDVVLDPPRNRRAVPASKKRP